MISATGRLSLTPGSLTLCEQRLVASAGSASCLDICLKALALPTRIQRGLSDERLDAVERVGLRPSNIEAPRLSKRARVSQRFAVAQPNP
jgi:hypothetical protein